MPNNFQRSVAKITVFFAFSVSATLGLYSQSADVAEAARLRTTAPAASSSMPGDRVAGPKATLESIAPNRLVVVYRGGVVPLNAAALVAEAGAQVVHHVPLFGVSAVRSMGDANTTIANLLAHPEVAAVLHDRIVKAHAMQVLPVRARIAAPDRTTGPDKAAGPDKTGVPTSSLSAVGSPEVPFNRLKPPLVFPIVQIETGTYYDSPQGWATVLAGGYGNNIPGGPAVGPWNSTQGAGVRIAVLDSGVDKTHPGIAPNLALNLSEIDQVAMPSACDDGSPQDQSGHGTFTASLAAAANSGSKVIGVAPQAAILNIKVVQRMPAATGATPLAQCEAGTANGLLSWVLQGIQDAVANHASVISLSLGTLVDTTTGDGAGWQAQMDSVTYAAMQAGAVLIAATGNDGLDLTASHYVELPAQARGVLPVVASTNPACIENLTPNAGCIAGPISRAYYSNFGSGLNAIAAPGGSYPEGADFAVSGFVRGACSNGLPNTTDGMPGGGQSFGCFSLGHVAYLQATGTSAAAPLVAGAAALLRTAHPDWTATQVIAALRSSATNSGRMAEPSLNLPAAMSLQ